MCRSNGWLPYMRTKNFRHCENLHDLNLNPRYNSLLIIDVGNSARTADDLGDAMQKSRPAEEGVNQRRLTAWWQCIQVAMTSSDRPHCSRQAWATTLRHSCDFSRGQWTMSTSSTPAQVHLQTTALDASAYARVVDPGSAQISLKIARVAQVPLP